jgi:hypothetical protein
MVLVVEASLQNTLKIREMSSKNFRIQTVCPPLDLSISRHRRCRPAKPIVLTLIVLGARCFSLAFYMYLYDAKHGSQMY